jgi:UDP-N-acetyl-D-glucosamine dehydrogenase
VPVFPETREHHFDLSSVELTDANVGEFDCLLLATDHERFDYDLIAKASLVIDSRGRLPAAANVVKA